MNPVTAEVKAYGWLIELCIAVLVVVMAFFGGCSVQRDHDKAGLLQVQGQRDAAYESLNAAAATLKLVNTEADRALTLAKKGEQAALEAGKAATLAEQAAKAQVDTFKSRLLKAEKTPACKSLLDTNVGAICALASH